MVIYSRGSSSNPTLGSFTAIRWRAHTLLLIFALFAAVPSYAAHVEFGPCPDVHNPGTQSLTSTYKDKVTGQPVHDGMVVPSTVDIQMDFVATSQGSCETWAMNYQSNMCELVKTDERDMIKVGVKVHIQGVSPGGSSSVDNDYQVGNVFGMYPDGTTNINLNVLDTQSPDTTGPVTAYLYWIGRYDYTITSFFESLCGMEPHTITERLTIYARDSTDDENLGCPAGAVGVGNPCNAKTGNKYQREVDWSAATLKLERHYNSKLLVDYGLGIGWTTRYHRRLERFANKLWARRERGSGEPFTKDSAGWQREADSGSSLTEDADGFVLRLADGSTEYYDPQGRLQREADRVGQQTTFQYNADGRLASVTGPFGHTIAFSYDSGGHIQQAMDPAGRTYTYAYDSKRNLVSVTYPDARTRIYHYENAQFLNALTGITDENGKRFATFAYDENGRAISTEHANGAERATLGSYSGTSTTGSTVVTDALGEARTYAFRKILGVWKLTGITGAPCDYCGGARSLTYDANGNVTSRTDFNGNVTTYTYDLSRNLETSRTEASGTPQARTITTQWHSSFDLPTHISEPNRDTVFSYFPNGNLEQRTISGGDSSRSWSYTYNSVGQRISEDGPRTDILDVTTFSYDDRGNLETVTDALGHVIRLTQYDAYGHPGRILDPNGVVTELGYDSNGRLASRTVGMETTTYEYDGVGQLVRITPPSGAYLEYGHDDAHRVTSVTDALGNRIVYTLDAVGNRRRQDVYDPGGILKRTHSVVYDHLNRLVQEIGAQNQIIDYTYDDAGNLVGVTDPLGHSTLSTYDALNRLIQVADTENGVTTYGHNALDQLTSVTDPRNLTTTYVSDPLGNVGTLNSPDSGITQFDPDTAGNIVSRKDAKGQTTTYKYDALNRLTKINYADSSTVTYTYDQGGNGIGRRTGVADASGSTGWSYDAHGRVTQKSQTVGNRTLVTKYTYDNAGLRTHITLPSGRVVRYEWANGKVVNIFVDNGLVTGAQIAVEMTHDPFGPPASWRFGNGEIIERIHDLDGRLSSHALGAIGYDEHSQVASIVQGNRSVLRGSKTYGYDALDRLTSYQDAASTITYRYDANGNRRTHVGAGANVTYDIDPASNRISQITAESTTVTYQHDANGSVTSDGINTYGYDAAGRLRTAATGSYRYNGLGQRVQKVITPVAAGLPVPGLSTTTLFVYDEAGHLIGEYDGSGNLIQETVWLDDLPLAVLKPEGNYYIHADHLGTPRQIDNQQQQAVWVWDTITFGDSIPNENPSGIGVPFKYSLRHAGQYYDAESGLFQNWYRDYDPSTGRYLQVDPLLLPNRLLTSELAFFVPVLLEFPEWLSPYNYVTNTPLSEIDPMGLGPLNFIKCLYYGRQIAKFREQCEGECPKDMEGQIDFMQKHNADFMGEAMLTCTCEKADPELCTKWLANCVATPIIRGPR